MNFWANAKKYLPIFIPFVFVIAIIVIFGTLGKTQKDGSKSLTGEQVHVDPNANYEQQAKDFLAQHGIAITKSGAVEAQKNFESEGGKGRVYSVPISSYDAFRGAVMGNGYDIDNAYGYQCWDGVALLYQQVGRTLSTGGTGAAKGAYTPANGGGDFTLIPASQAERGDIVVFGSGIGRYGHIGFLDGKWGSRISVLGQNQSGNGNGSPFNVVQLSSAYVIGAIRFNPWHVAPTPTPTPTPTPPAPAPRPIPASTPAPSYSSSYTVKKGDTLGGIILKMGWRDQTLYLFGDNGQAQVIADHNGIVNRGIIYPGQIIYKK